MSEYDWKKHGKRSRTKGRDYEQLLVREARKREFSAFRQLQSQGELSSGADLVIGATREAGYVQPAELRDPVHVEAKCRRNFSSAAVAEITGRGLVAAVKISNVGQFFALPSDLFWNLLRTQREADAREGE